MVEDGYEFFAKRQLVTIFSAPNYCGEFENAGAMMSVDETLMCSFQVRLHVHRLRCVQSGAADSAVSNCRMGCVWLSTAGPQQQHQLSTQNLSITTAE